MKIFKDKWCLRAQNYPTYAAYTLGTIHYKSSDESVLKSADLNITSLNREWHGSMLLHFGHTSEMCLGRAMLVFFRGNTIAFYRQEDIKYLKWIKELWKICFLPRNMEQKHKIIERTVDV